MMYMKRFKHLKIHKQLLISYIALIILPISIIGIGVYEYVSNYISDQMTRSFEVVNAQISQSLDNYFLSVATVSEYPLYNDRLTAILEKDYGSVQFTEYERIKDYDVVMNEFILSTLLTNNTINSLDLYAYNTNTIYTKGKSQTLNFDYRPYLEDWYLDIIKANGNEFITGIRKNSQVTPSDHVVSIGRYLKSPESGKGLGVMLVNVRAETLKSLYKESRITPSSRELIVDQNKRVVYSSNLDEIGSTVDRDLMNSFAVEGKMQEIELGSEKMLVVASKSAYTGWTVVSLVSKKELLSGISELGNVLLGSAIFFSILAVVISVAISSRIAKPIQQLSGAMESNTGNELPKLVEENGGPEIKSLSVAYNQLIMRIQLLIERIQAESEKRRTAELAALQAQIRPHFIYNTLSVIKRMAQMQGAHGIVKALDAFIHIMTFLSKNTSEFVSFEEEEAFLQNYVSLLRLRYFNRFEMDIEIDPEVKQSILPKFLLQPLIENAVFHAFPENSLENRVHVNAEKDGDNILIRVSDNGVGIPHEIIDKVSYERNMSSGLSESIGISNVIERIRTLYGNSADFRIVSELGMGTSIEFRIPERSHS